MEVSSTKHHSIPGQAGVTGGEAQARLPDPVLPLRGGAEQGGVPRAGPVRHVHWPGPVATFAILNQLKDFLITLAHEVGGGYKLQYFAMSYHRKLILWISLRIRVTTYFS